MTWNNYGKNGWEIDHIIPCSYFDFSDPEQQYICFNFRNLQPLWKDKNSSKRDRIPDNYIEILEDIKNDKNR